MNKKKFYFGRTFRVPHSQSSGLSAHVSDSRNGLRREAALLTF